MGYEADYQKSIDRQARKSENEANRKQRNKIHEESRKDSEEKLRAQIAYNQEKLQQRKNEIEEKQRDTDNRLRRKEEVEIELLKRKQEHDYEMQQRDSENDLVVERMKGLNAIEYATHTALLGVRVKEYEERFLDTASDRKINEEAHKKINTIGVEYAKSIFRRSEMKLQAKLNQSNVSKEDVTRWIDEFEKTDEIES
jgi:hypothetical protein